MLPTVSDVYHQCPHLGRKRRVRQFSLPCLAPLESPLIRCNYSSSDPECMAEAV